MRRTIVCRIAAGALAGVVVLGLSACGEGRGPSEGGGASSGGAASQRPSPTVSSASPTPTLTSVPVPSPTVPQPSETFTPEQLEAANTVIEFNRIADATFSDPDADPQPLKDITIGQSQEIQLGFLADYRENGKVQTGTTIVHITGASEPADVDGVRTVDVQMCTDSGSVDVIETATGKSKVAPGRPRYLQWNVAVVKTAEGWKFGDATNDDASRCPA